MADALLQETKVKSGIPQGASSIRVVYQRPPKCHHCENTAFRRRLQDGLTTLIKRPFAEFVWNWPVNWDLSINPTKYNYIAIRRARPLQLCLATGSPGYCIQVANVANDLGVLIGNSFSYSIHCKEAASKARRMLFIVRRSFAKLSVSSFAHLKTRWFCPILSTLCRPARQTSSPTPIVWSESSSRIDEARRGFPPTAI